MTRIVIYLVLAMLLSCDTVADNKTQVVKSDRSTPTAKSASTDKQSSAAFPALKRITLPIDIKKGLLLPASPEQWEPCCLYIPENGLKLYAAASGDQVGVLKLTKPNSSSEFYESQIEYINGTTAEFKFKHFEMVGYEIYALKFRDSKGTFVQLENRMWIDGEEFSQSNLLVRSWFDYALQKEEILGWYANKPGLTLWGKPNKSSSQIKELKGDLLEINLTDETVNNWVKVRVDEYKAHPCVDPDSKPVNTYSGWIELIDDYGLLNIWFYEKGC